MPARLFIGYFVALAACATIASASVGADGVDAAGSLASEQPAFGQPLPTPAFHVHPNKILFKHVQVAQAE